MTPSKPEEPRAPKPTSPIVSDAVSPAAAQDRAAEPAPPNDQARDARETCRQVATAYVDNLNGPAQDKDGVRAMMHAFGRYLFRQGTQPQHIVVCAREAIQHDRLRDHIKQSGLTDLAIGWSIDGYYLEKASG